MDNCLFYDPLLQLFHIRQPFLASCRRLMWRVSSGVYTLFCGQYLLVWALSPVAPQMSQTWLRSVGQAQFPLLSLSEWLLKTLSGSPLFLQNWHSVAG